MKVIDVKVYEYLSTLGPGAVTFPFPGLGFFAAGGPPGLSPAFDAVYEFDRQILIKHITSYGRFGVDSGGIVTSIGIVGAFVRINSGNIVTDIPSKVTGGTPGAFGDALVTYPQELCHYARHEATLPIDYKVRAFNINYPLIFQLAVGAPGGSIWDSDPEINNFGLRIYYEEL